MLCERTNDWDHSGRCLRQLLRESSTLTTLSLAECDLGPEGMRAVCAGIVEGSQLTALDLSGANEIGERGALAVARAIRRCPSLCILSFRRCHAWSPRMWEEVFQALAQTQQVAELDLSGNNTPAGLQGPGGTCGTLAAAVAASSALVSLNLSSSGFGAHMHALGSGIRTNSSLTKIQLAHTSAPTSYEGTQWAGVTGKEAALEVVEALGGNKRLLHLDLSHNQWGLGQDCAQAWDVPRACSSLTVLNLVGCFPPPLPADALGGSATRLGALVRALPALTSLDLSGNTLDDAGMAALGRVVAESTSLRKLLLSRASAPCLPGFISPPPLCCWWRCACMPQSRPKPDHTAA